MNNADIKKALSINNVERKFEIVWENYIDSLTQYKKPLFNIRRRGVRVRETIIDEDIREFDISSSKSPIIMGLSNPSVDELSETITNYKIIENKGKVKRL